MLKFVCEFTSLVSVVFVVFVCVIVIGYLQVIVTCYKKPLPVGRCWIEL